MCLKEPLWKCWMNRSCLCVYVFMWNFCIVLIKFCCDWFIVEFYYFYKFLSWLYGVHAFICVWVVWFDLIFFVVKFHFWSIFLFFFFYCGEFLFHLFFTSKIINKMFGCLYWSNSFWGWWVLFCQILAASCAVFG